MQQFVQRIFAQLVRIWAFRLISNSQGAFVQHHMETTLQVQTRIENTLQKAQDRSSLAYLRKLSACHAATAQLVADLHKLDDSAIAQNLGGPALTGILNRSFEDLFVPYVEGDRYIEVEEQCLVDRFKSCLHVFHEYAVRYGQMLLAGTISNPNSRYYV